MLLANRSLGELINKTKREFVYRVHDLPDNEKLENLKSIIKKQTQTTKSKISNLFFITLTRAKNP